MAWKKNRLTKYAKTTIIPPTNGWKENTYYLVDVAHSPGNPIHRAILSVRSIHSTGIPNGVVWSGTYGEPSGVLSLRYLKGIQEIPFGKSETTKTPDDLEKEQEVQS